MPAKHPIFDHLERDAQSRDPRHRPAPSAGLQTPPAVSRVATPVAQPRKTSGLKQPIAKLPGTLMRVLRKLKLMISPNHNQPAGPVPTQALAPAMTDRQSDRLVAAAQRLWLRSESVGRLTDSAGNPATGRFVDILTATPGEPKLPDEVFPRLRWGGLLLYVGPNEKSVRNLAEAYDNKRGFILEQPVTTINANTMGMRIPGMTPRGYAFLARKIRLIQPGDFTERFTYDVQLTRCNKTPDSPDGYVVTKRVPNYEELVGRLRQKFPDTEIDDLRARARKLVEHVFPTFITREAAMLGILQKNLAPEFRHKVPKPLGIEKDKRGFVRTLHMKWMRIGGDPITQLDFAVQSADLLAALHDQARVMHLDLRMDNMVITPDGVGFVDFGSACRIGEHVEKSPMLGTLFTEMMRTSQIQRMLGKMIERGHVTNNAIADVYGKVDKTVDAFYLAVQIAKPHANPDLKQLIEYDPQTDTAKALSALTAAVLRPKNPEMAQYKSAGDLVRGLRRITRRVSK